MVTGNDGRPPEGIARFPLCHRKVVTALETGTGVLVREPLFGLGRTSWSFPCFWGIPWLGLPPGRARPPFPPKCFLRRGGVGLSGMHKVGFTPPVGLEQDAVDVGQLDGFGIVADGFQQRGDAQVARTTQEAVGGADEEIERLGGKGAMSQAAQVELGEDKIVDLFGVEARERNRIGHAGLDFLVDGEVEGGNEGR